MKSRTILITALSITNTLCDTETDREARDGGQHGGYVAPVSSGGGYAAPSSGYGASSGGGYAAPSGGYGAPSGGYGAPCDSYGCSAGAPVYVYQQEQEQVDAGGALAALLPLGALALLVPLGLLAFGTLFPATTIVTPAGRKRRSAAEYGNMTSVEKQEALLQSYMDTVGQMPDLSIQKDMVAKYLECGSEPSLKKDSPSLHGCLQKLSCVLYDKSVKISDGEKEIANIVLDSIFENEFVSKDLKKRLQLAGKKGFKYPGSCHAYKCHHHLLPKQF